LLSAGARDQESTGSRSRDFGCSMSPHRINGEVMRALLGLLSLVVLSSALLFGQAPAGGGPRPLAFTHVTVIDATGSPAQPDMTVVVTGDRITALGKFGAVPVPANAQVTEARGRFMIPG